MLEHDLCVARAHCDEPGDRSLTDYALSTTTRAKVVNATSPRLYNLMWPLMGERIATHYYDNHPNMLDQFLSSRGLTRTAGDLRVLDDTVEILRFPEMVHGGRYPVPIRFGSPSSASSFNRDGFSDHYPIAVTIRERD